MKHKKILLNSKCVIILVLRWYNSNSNTTPRKLSLSLSYMHVHTRSYYQLNVLKSARVPAIHFSSLVRVARSGRFSGAAFLSCENRHESPLVHSPFKCKADHAHYNLSTAVADHHHLHLLRAKTCTNHLSCTRLFGARSTLECRRRRRRNRRTSVPTRAKICNSLLSCTRLVRTRSTSVYPRQTSLSLLVCTLHISSVCFPTLSRRKTLVRRT